MRVIFRMRAGASGAILAASAIFAAVSLAGCGQRGPLYMPTVPPLPARPNFETQDTGTAAAATSASDAEDGSVPDTSGTPLKLSPELSPDTSLSPTSPAPASPQAAPSAKPTY